MTSAFHCVRTAARAASSARAFSTSAAAAARRNVIHGTRADRPVAEDLLPDDAEDPEDTTWAGHMSLQQQRDELYYQRLIEHEIPKLARHRKPFVPPTAATPLVVRSVAYAGEDKHPLAPKRVVTAAVARLPLSGPTAIHKFKLLAGVRWSREPPKDAGLARDEPGGEHGYIKISCEDFGKPAMNLKWISDTLDRLIAEANDTKDTMADIPLDTTHLEAKARKGKRGDHPHHGRVGPRPTIRDFPKEWLPNQPTSTSPVAAS